MSNSDDRLRFLLALFICLSVLACHKRSVDNVSTNSNGSVELSNPDIDPDDSDGIFVGNGNQEKIDHNGLFLTSCYLEEQNIAICGLSSDFNDNFDFSLVNIVDANGVVISASDLQLELLDENSQPKLKIVAREDVLIKGIVDTSNDEPISLEKKKSSVGMSLAAIGDLSTQIPFLNLAKSARMWASQRQGMSWEDGSNLDLDENGYVKSLEADQKAHLVILTLHGYPLPFDRLIVRYEGSGAIAYDGLIKDEDSSVEGRHVLSIDTNSDKNRLMLSIESTDPANYIRNLSIVPENFVELFDKGEVFNPLWVEKVKAFKLFKFTEWMATDSSTLTSWEQRPLEDQISYAFAPPGRYGGLLD
ncbi:MAG: hypothetical protein HRU09_20815 [Oligoflexales bacterium]|nr:hypothetical protein [Oligoflexales bacterium]